MANPTLLPLIDKRAIYEAVCERSEQWYGPAHMKGGSCLHWSTTLAGSPWREESQAELKLSLLPEIHVWVGLPDSKEIVDFSTKYFPQHAAAEGLEWRTAPPPDFLWCGPADVVYTPNLDAIASILKRILENQILKKGDHE